MWSQKVSRYLHYITAANVGHNVFVMISSAWALNQTASVILLYYYLVRKILLWSWEGRTPENSGMRLYLFIWQSSLYNAIEIYKIINHNRVSLSLIQFNYPEIQRQGSGWNTQSVWHHCFLIYLDVDIVYHSFPVYNVSTWKTTIYLYLVRGHPRHKISCKFATLEQHKSEITCCHIIV